MKPRISRTLSVLLLIAFIAGTAAVASYIARLAATGGIVAADGRLAELRPWLLLARFALYAGVVGGWPWWTAAAARQHRWNPSQTASMEALRWRVAIWFLVYEVAFAQAGLVRLLRFTLA